MLYKKQNRQVALGKLPYFSDLGPIISICFHTLKKTPTEVLYFAISSRKQVVNNENINLRVHSFCETSKALACRHSKKVYLNMY